MMLQMLAIDVLCYNPAMFEGLLPGMCTYSLAKEVIRNSSLLTMLHIFWCGCDLMYGSSQSFQSIKLQCHQYRNMLSVQTNAQLILSPKLLKPKNSNEVTPTC